MYAENYKILVKEIKELNKDKIRLEGTHSKDRFSLNISVLNACIWFFCHLVFLKCYTRNVLAITKSHAFSLKMEVTRPKNRVTASPGRWELGLGDIFLDSRSSLLKFSSGFQFPSMAVINNLLCTLIWPSHVLKCLVICWMDTCFPVLIPVSVCWGGVRWDWDVM